MRRRTDALRWLRQAGACRTAVNRMNSVLREGRGLPNASAGGFAGWSLGGTCYGLLMRGGSRVNHYAWLCRRLLFIGRAIIGWAIIRRGVSAATGVTSAVGRFGAGVAASAARFVAPEAIPEPLLTAVAGTSPVAMVLARIALGRPFVNPWVDIELATSAAAGCHGGNMREQSASRFAACDFAITATAIGAWRGTSLRATGSAIFGRTVDMRIGSTSHGGEKCEEGDPLSELQRVHSGEVLREKRRRRIRAARSVEWNPFHTYDYRPQAQENRENRYNWQGLPGDLVALLAVGWDWRPVHLDCQPVYRQHALRGLINQKSQIDSRQE